MRDPPKPRAKVIPNVGAVAAALLALAWTAADPARAGPAYSWLSASAGHDTLTARIGPPPGFERETAAPGSWTEWLRGLPLKPAGSAVLTYTGAPKWRQDVHAAVIGIDTGKRDLQQCADAVMRLRAEWLYASGRTRDIAFNDTDGKRRRFAAQSKQDYASFRKYMDLVFAYAGTWSLERELKPAKVEGIQVGDVFIKGGFPGHAILVTDLVRNPKTGETRFLLTQSYMPAQDIHVLNNPNSKDGSPWYAMDFGDQLETPEWNFPRTSLKRWP